MLAARKTRTRSPVHAGFNKGRQPLLRGDARNCVIDRVDRAAFVAEVIRVRFAPAAFGVLGTTCELPQTGTSRRPLVQMVSLSSARGAPTRPARQPRRPA
jgi:hypothetical protein